MSPGSIVTCVGVSLVALLIATPAEGQGKRGDKGPDLTVQVVLASGQRDVIRTFYTEAGPRSVEALPPGIRKNLARGKPLPPGIAKRQVPGELRSRLGVPDGYEVVEVGLDVLLVEVATGLIHDLLMDVIR